MVNKYQLHLLRLCLKSLENFASSREGSVMIKAGLCKLNSP